MHTHSRTNTDTHQRSVPNAHAPFAHIPLREAPLPKLLQQVLQLPLPAQVGEAWVQSDSNGGLGESDKSKRCRSGVGGGRPLGRVGRCIGRLIHESVQREVRQAQISVSQTDQTIPPTPPPVHYTRALATHRSSPPPSAARCHHHHRHCSSSPPPLHCYRPAAPAAAAPPSLIACLGLVVDGLLSVCVWWGGGGVVPIVSEQCD
jgi:hypothetical protein